MTYKLRDFLPLIIIFAVILAFTAYMDWSMRYFMGGFFVVFGAFKAMKLKSFAMAYREYDIIAKRSRAYAYAYPFIELGLGAAYLANYQIFYISIITVVVMLVSAWGVWLKLRQKEVVPCACLGTVFKIPMTYVTLFEDLLMAVMAMLILLLL